MSEMTMLSDMPIQPKNIGRQFVHCYYSLMNKSPENLFKLYTEDAQFCHDAVGLEQQTISATGKKAILEVILERLNNVRHTSTRVTTVDTTKTIEDGLIVQLLGEISFNNSDFRPFSQTFFLVQQTPFKYFVQNDIFRFNEQEPDTTSLYPESIMTEDQTSGCDVENTSFDAYEQIDEEEMIEPIANDDKLEECPEMNKSIIELQSYNLKNVLLEPRAISKENIMKRVPTPEHGSQADVNDEMAKNQNQLFQDKCILTIGNVINPNIEFDDDVSTAPTDERDNAQINDERMDKKEAMYREKKRAMHARKRKEKKRLSRAQKTENEDALANESSIQTDSPERHTNLTTIEPIESWASETEASPKCEIESANKSKPSKETAQETTSLPLASKPKTFADLVKKEQSGQKDEWQDDWKNEPIDRRSSDTFSRSSKTRSSMNRRGRQEKQVSPKDSYQSKRSSSNGDLLQIFVGQIPHGANEEEIRSMFGRFGSIRRFQMYSNPRSARVPLYAFIVYESIQSVQRCLSKRNSFYWPENSKNGQKLNVNGDQSLMGDAEHSSPPSSYESVTYKKSVKSIGTDTADLKNFHKNFILAEPKDSTNNRRSSITNTNITDVVSTVKHERKTISRSGSTRA